MNPWLKHECSSGRWIAWTAALGFMSLIAPLARGAELKIAWTNNILTIAGPSLPGGTLDVWYLEAFCRHGSTQRDWSQTVIPHQTKLLSLDPDRRRIRLQSRVEPAVTVDHEIQAGSDEVAFHLTFKNNGTEFADVQWFQPCIRVDRFTGKAQSNYVDRCFIFTEKGLTTLDQTRRREEARYRGGQVYVPPGVNLDDVNPRPISPDVPTHPLIGCFSADGTFLLATAWDATQELFQGVIVCLHNDPRVGGLKPGETRQLRGKIYFLKNDPAELLARYRNDFQ